MTNLIRAELRKYTSTRLMWGMGLAIFVIGLGFSAIFGAVANYAGFEESAGGAMAGSTLADVIPNDVLARFIYLSSIQLGYLLTLCVGVVVIGQEYRHKTATSTFLAEPRRTRVIVAKCAALGVIGTANGLLFLLGSVIGGGTLLALNGLSVFPEPTTLLRSFALGLLVLVLWAWIGLGAGVLISNQIVALLIAIAFAWIVDPLLTFALSFVSWGSDIAQYFPGSASTAAVDLVSGVPAEATDVMGFGSTSLSWYTGAVVLAVYALVMTGFGLYRTRRRDIS